MSQRTDLEQHEPGEGDMSRLSARLEDEDQPDKLVYDLTESPSLPSTPRIAAVTLSTQPSPIAHRLGPSSPTRSLPTDRHTTHIESVRDASQTSRTAGVPSRVSVTAPQPSSQPDEEPWRVRDPLVLSRHIERMLMVLSVGLDQEH